MIPNPIKFPTGQEVHPLAPFLCLPLMREVGRRKPARRERKKSFIFQLLFKKITPKISPSVSLFG